MSYLGRQQLFSWLCEVLFDLLLEEVAGCGGRAAGLLTDRLGNLTLIRGSVGTMVSKLM